MAMTFAQEIVVSNAWNFMLESIKAFVDLPLVVASPLMVWTSLVGAPGPFTPVLMAIPDSLV